MVQTTFGFVPPATPVVADVPKPVEAKKKTPKMKSVWKRNWKEQEQRLSEMWWNK